MAVRKWIGGTDNTHDETANWEGGTAAATGDIMLVGSFSTGDYLTAPGSAVALAGLYVQPGCRINIGASGSAIGSNLSVDNGTNAMLRIAGSGNVFIAGSTDITSVERAGGGIVSLTGGTCGRLIVQDGYFQLGSSATATATYLYGGKSLLLGTAATLDVLGGEHETRSNLTLARLAGGALKAINAVTATDIIQYGGRLLWESSGAITTLYGHGGVEDSSASKSSITITTLYRNARAFKILETPPGVDVNIGTEVPLGGSRDQLAA